MCRRYCHRNRQRSRIAHFWFHHWNAKRSWFRGETVNAVAFGRANQKMNCRASGCLVRRLYRDRFQFLPAHQPDGFRALASARLLLGGRLPSLPVVWWRFTFHNRCIGHSPACCMPATPGPSVGAPDEALGHKLIQRPVGSALAHPDPPPLPEQTRAWHRGRALVHLGRALQSGGALPPCGGARMRTAAPSAGIVDPALAQGFGRVRTGAAAGVGAGG
jgi:hypothetical protein